MQYGGQAAERERGVPEREPALDLVGELLGRGLGGLERALAVVAGEAAR
jgi:hypothetical protein